MSEEIFIQRNSNNQPTVSKFPSEQIDLPSEGCVYPKNHPLSSGKVELKYMTAREEDILTNSNNIRRGNALDKLLESLIVEKNVKIDDLITSDKSALIIACRRLAYGDSYGPFKFKCPKCSEESQHTFDISKLKNITIPEENRPSNTNFFEFTLPFSKRTIAIKLLTHKDENDIENELKALKKISADNVPELSTRLKYHIVSVDGNSDKGYIRSFVDKELLSRDSLELRRFLKKMSPDVELKFDFQCNSCNFEDRLEVPLTAEFFWPST